MLPGQIFVRVQTQSFAYVSEYGGNLYITNKIPGNFKKENIQLE